MFLRASLLACAFVAGPTLAANYSVTTAADGGPGSLRQAVAAANANPGADLISIGNVGAITLTSGTLLVTDVADADEVGPGSLRQAVAAAVVTE